MNYVLLFSPPSFFTHWALNYLMAVRLYGNGKVKLEIRMVANPAPETKTSVTVLQVLFPTWERVYLLAVYKFLVLTT